MPILTFCVCKSSSLEMHDAKWNGSIRLGLQNSLFGGLRWLQSGQIQLPGGAATASTDPVPLSGIKESPLNRSATNINQRCFDAYVSLMKKR